MLNIGTWNECPLKLDLTKVRHIVLQDFAATFELTNGKSVRTIVPFTESAENLPIISEYDMFGLANEVMNAYRGKKYGFTLANHTFGD